MLTAEKIAHALSVLARLQGVSVPVYRFGAMDQHLSGLDSVQRVARAAIEMWRVRFPEGVEFEVRYAEVVTKDFPMLWISDAGDRLEVITGTFADGGVSVDSSLGSDTPLSQTEASAGVFLSLLVQRSEELLQKRPATASSWFWFALKKRRRVFIEAIGATFLMNLLGIFTAMYTMQVYDRVIPTQGFSTLWALTIGVAMAILFEFLMRQVRSIMTERASKAIDIELSEVFFQKALNIRMDARPPTVGTFASQIRHFESVRSFLTSAVLFVLADVPFALLFIAVVALIGGYLAIVPIVTVPLAILISLLFRGVIERLTQQHMKESNQKNGLLIEAVDGIESIKATGSEWKIRDLYMSLTRSISSSELRLKILSSRASHLAMLIQQVNYVGLIAVGAYAISEGELSMGGLIASSIIMGRIFNPLAQVPNLVVQWKHAQIALQSLDSIMAMPEDRTSGARLVVPDRPPGDIKLENVTFSYDGAGMEVVVPALRIKPGEKIAIIGPVGSGKSTLLKMLSGLYAPRQGRISFDGVDIQHLAPEYVRENVGYLPQEIRLFNGSLRSNLTIGLPAIGDSSILQACMKTGLGDFLRSRPDGLEVLITEGGRGLSGGQKQLVGLTRLLLMSPKIMLLDEPTASMDGELEVRVMNHLFKNQAPDATMVVVTHKRAVLSQVDRIIVVNEGRIAVDGTRDEVLEKINQMSRGS